ncbi:MAG: ATP-dependent helicase, partial [Anaerolineae bacterium]|nr:ATP-dependent helicase [Anaerolineae bacterium]
EEILKEREIEYVLLLRSTPQTRKTAGVLGNVMNYLADPVSPRKLAKVYEVWRSTCEDGTEDDERVEKVIRILRGCKQVEDFLWPRAEHDWLAALRPDDEILGLRAELEEFRELVRRWQGATLLPIDQLTLTLAQDLFSEPVDLALAHKLAGLLRRAAETNREWQLPELTEELAVIARNQRRFLGLGEGDEQFDPDAYKGRVVIATIHRAKGLEWDRVYLMSVNNYSFPSAMAHDSFIAEKWFLKDRLNLEAEALAQLEMLQQDDAIYDYVEGEATKEARLGYVAERLRLFFVGITRARKELIVTWNTGQRGDCQQAVPFIELQTFWESRTVGS